MTLAPHYQAVLEALALKFFNDLPAREKPKPGNYVATLQADLRTLLAPVAEETPWKQWSRVQQWKMQTALRESQYDQTKKIANAELCFLADVALLEHTRRHTLLLPWQALEYISAAKIDRNVKTGDLAEAKLPTVLWVEWPHTTHHTGQPWIDRTVGMLISRLLLLDAPIDDLRAIGQPHHPDADYTLELIRTLVQIASQGSPCSGYRLTIVQQDNSGYRFIVTMFGNENKETLASMLAVHKDVSDRDRHKYKQAEQVWSNLAVRVLLFAAHHALFRSQPTESLIDQSLPAAPALTNIFFREKKNTGGQIALRPDYHTSYRPFRIESE